MSEPKVLYRWKDGPRACLLVDGMPAREHDREGECWNAHAGPVYRELARLAPLAPLLDERWTPDEAGLAALPERVRDYIHELLYKAEGLEDLRVMQEDQLKADIEAMRDARASLAEKEAQLAEAGRAFALIAEWAQRDDTRAFISALAGKFMEEWNLARVAEADRLRREVCEAALALDDAEVAYVTADCRAQPLQRAQERYFTALDRLRAAREKEIDPVQAVDELAALLPDYHQGQTTQEIMDELRERYPEEESNAEGEG